MWKPGSLSPPPQHHSTLLRFCSTPPGFRVHRGSARRSPPELFTAKLSGLNGADIRGWAPRLLGSFQLLPSLDDSPSPQKKNNSSLCFLTERRSEPRVSGAPAKGTKALNWRRRTATPDSFALASLQSGLAADDHGGPAHAEAPPTAPLPRQQRSAQTLGRSFI